MNKTGKRFAIVIGITDYSRVAPNHNLRFAANDAARLYEILHTKAGFDKQNLHLFTDAAPAHLDKVAKQPTRSDIISCVNTVASNAAADDLILLFFAGHGCEISGNSYLLTNDTRMDVVRDTAVEVSAINKYLGGSKAKCILRVFDACRSGFGDARLMPATMSRGLEAAFLHAAIGWSTFNSCSAGECAYEHPDLKQGIFTYYLCEGLNGAANPSGSVTWERLIDYVKISVSNFCKEHSYSQTPHVITDLSGSVELISMEAKATTNETKGGAPTVTTADTLQAELRSALDKHAANLSSDVRDFRLTSPAEHAIAQTVVLDAISAQLNGFAHKTMSITVTKKPQVQQFDGSIYHEIVQAINKAGINAEFQDTLAANIQFTSSELAFPSSALTLVIVKFQFFYWLWHRHVCLPNKALAAWTPQPNQAQGFFTLKPGAAVEPSKIQPLVQQTLVESFRRISIWCEQSAEFLTNRIEPLRKVGPIIS